MPLEFILCNMIHLHAEICLATISVALFLQVMVSFVLEFCKCYFLFQISHFALVNVLLTLYFQRSFLGNRINGYIPEALGDMSTLEEL